MNSAIPLELLANEFEEHPYQKKLKKDLKQKKAEQARLANQTNVTPSSETVQQNVQAFLGTEHSKSYYEDRFESDTETKENIEEASADTILPDTRRFDPSKLWRLISYKLNDKQRINQLKQSYHDTLQQYYSHNDILSQFSSFKASVLGKILDKSGVDAAECKKIRQSVKKQVFEENKHLMAENIYHLELSELLYGKKKNTRPQRAKMLLMQQKLLYQMQKMDNSYWNKERLLEEKITQSKKIREELVDERKNLRYFVDQLFPDSIVGKVNTTAEHIYLQDSEKKDA